MEDDEPHFYVLGGDGKPHRVDIHPQINPVPHIYACAIGVVAALTAVAVYAIVH